MPQVNSNYNLGFRLVRNAADGNGSVTGSEEDFTIGKGENMLIAYFSWGGNTRGIAEEIQRQTGAKLFEIQLVEPYSTDYNTVLEQAQQDQNEQARPALSTHVENMEQYDTIILGYPNWWYGVPMALLTFLEQNDLSGKDVYLICSHGTGGLARSVELITKAAPNANISDSVFDCYEEDAAVSEADIKAWVNELGFGPADSAGQAQDTRQLQVQSDGGTVIYQLNDSAAAAALLAQLPLTVEVEDYSTNEKIFYPPEALDTVDTPLAEGGDGTLAYYAPWGDVVMFYGDYNANGSLYELGEVVSGGELIAGMSGTVTIETAQ